ncbi:hypothetical protein HPP92_015197 [Vanilla planifolia]|uniref:ubiquitinyl hydrolase 1 n=1 Tax=Vanilla planifolia TaxID=51239 RepID=A0A835QN34_VANPL|nr:hypothetical protein HPP92_015197 [Vanilla planifolia]
MEENDIYHERQRLQFCLMHALNNLLQEDSFSRNELDTIGNKLAAIDPDKERWSPFSLVLKPHHNALTGNYDANVLISALESRNKRVIWHDHRNHTSSINLIAETLVGILINIPVRRFGGLWKSRHWVAIRRIGDVWYNLDSDLAAPKAFSNADEQRGRSSSGEADGRKAVGGGECLSMEC